MSDKLKYKAIARKEFEDFIFSKYKAQEVHWSFYIFDWYELQINQRQVYRDKPIHEFIYVIQLSEKYGVLIYSGINRINEDSRPVGKDAIRLVPVKLYYFDPIRHKETRINRIQTWKENFNKRVRSIKKELLVVDRKS